MGGGRQRGNRRGRQRQRQRKPRRDPDPFDDSEVVKVDPKEDPFYLENISGPTVVFFYSLQTVDDAFFVTKI